MARVLISRPDQGGTFADLAPSLIMNDADLPATQLIQPGSRVSYSAAVRRRSRAHRELQDVAAQRTRRAAERMRDISEASPQIKNAVDRAGRFLSLASLVSVLLCAIAVAMSRAALRAAASRFGRADEDAWGARAHSRSSVSTLQLLVDRAVSAALIGSAAGFLRRNGCCVAMRGSARRGAAARRVWLPLVVGFLTAVAVLAGFRVAAAAATVARAGAARAAPGCRAAAAGRVAGFRPGGHRGRIPHLLGRARHWLFAASPAASRRFCCVLAGAGAVLVHLAGRLRGGVGVAWRYGLANLSRRRAESLVQIVAFGVGFMVLLLLGDRAQRSQRGLAAAACRSTCRTISSSTFRRRSALRSWPFSQAAARRLARVLPMIRGRLTQINGTAGRGACASRRRTAKASPTREQNLTWAEELGADNRIVAGQMVERADFGKPLVSLATEFQESLGVKLGDRLTFDMAGETIRQRASPASARSSGTASSPISSSCSRRACSRRPRART